MQRPVVPFVRGSRPISALAFGLLAAVGCSTTAGQTTASADPARPQVAAAPSMPDATYYVYVGAESADLLHRIRFGPDGASIDQTIEVGEMAVETEGPHGLNISADGEYLYMTTGHGVPDGKLWKYHAGPDTLVASPILLGWFPATLDLTPDGLYAFVANFNLHGEMVPSSISVVYTPDMVEVEQIETCVMPHGARMEPSGIFLYTNCMMDDLMVEVDTRSFEVSRRFSVATGREGLVERSADHGAMGSGGDHDMSGGHDPTCSPTWVQPSPDGRLLYVACNKANYVLEIERESLDIRRRFETGRAPYNLAVTPDGRMLVATLKAEAAVEFIDLDSGESLGRIPSSTTVTHGVTISPDSRYAFVSVEGVGAEPGKVDIYDLRERIRLADVPIGQQAGGIIFWKMEEADGAP